MRDAMVEAVVGQAVRVSPAPLVVLMGETASGKTALAIRLAERFGGEIIAADSRTFYRGMDIGTAKPSPDEQAKVRHHLVDIADPDEPVTVAEFQRLAEEALEDIARRGKLPILVGGSGLYIDAFVYGFSLSAQPNAALRHRLQAMTVEELQSELRRKNIALPRNERNPRHLMRRIETGGAAVSSKELRGNTLLLQLNVERALLKRRVADRTRSMFDLGLPGEVQRLIARYSTACPAVHTIGYRECLPYLEGKATLDEAVKAVEHATLQYAKRQRTWFRRNKSIHHIWNEAEAVDILTTFLNNVRTV